MAVFVYAVAMNMYVAVFQSMMTGMSKVYVDYRTMVLVYTQTH